MFDKIKLMDEKFLDLFKFLDFNNFVNASEKDLKISLQQLCDYLAKTEGRKKIKLKFDFYKLKLKKEGKEDEIKDTLATSFINYICLMPEENLTNYFCYCEMIDCVIHESFHQFQYYFLNIPKIFVDDIMWQRILSYNIYFFASDKINDFSYYRFCDMELDAYRHTDFLLNKIYNKLSRKGADVCFLKKYILDERKEFAKDTKVLFKDLGSNAKFVVDEWFKAQAIKGLKEVEELEISDKKIFEKMKEGEFLFSVLDKSEIVYMPQKFLDSMTKNFKEYLPFLYGKTKPKFNNEKFFENL